MSRIAHLFDCWNQEDQWLTVTDICKLMGISDTKSVLYHLVTNELSVGSRGGVFKRKKIQRYFRVRDNSWHKRYVYSYMPESWVLHSVCDGYFKARIKEDEKK